MIEFFFGRTVGDIWGFGEYASPGRSKIIVPVSFDQDAVEHCLQVCSVLICVLFIKFDAAIFLWPAREAKVIFLGLWHVVMVFFLCVCQMIHGY